MAVEHNVQANYVVNPTPALRALGQIAAAAGRINRTFDAASRVLGGVAAVGGSVAAAFSFERIVSHTKEHLEMVKRISVLTKTGASDADAMVETFARVGLSGQDAERIMLGMSRRASMMDMSMQGVNRSVGGTRGLFQRMNIDIRKGIEPALLRMSELYEKGKLDVAQIGLAFGIPRQQALRMVELLEKGPRHIRQMIQESRRFAVGAQTMQQMERMEMASHAARAALTRMQVMIGSEIMPVIADLMESASEKIRSWLPAVREFGVFLRDNLTAALSTVVKMGKVLLANYALMKMTGSGIGGWAGRGLAFVRGGAAPSYGAIARTGNLLGRIPGVGGAFAGLAGMGNVTVLLRVLSMLGRLTIIGTVALVAWRAFEAIRNNTLGIRDSMLSFWRRLQAHFAVVARLFAPVAKLFGGDGTIGRFFTVVLVTAIQTLADLIEGIVTVVEVMVIAIRKLWASPTRAFDMPSLLVEAAREQQAMHRAAMAEQEAERRARESLDRGAPAERAGTTFNFHNARFDITQKFEEGFDPDRIAVAFVNDLAALGERRVQGALGLAGAFSR